VSESAPPTATSVVEDTIENARSRRRGTSKAWSTWTHRKSEARGTRAWSTVVSVPTWARKRPKAAISATARTTFSGIDDARRRRYEKR
jgi:hypothetical protein